MKSKLKTKFKHFDLIHNDGTVQDGKKVVKRNVLAAKHEEVILTVRDDYTHLGSMGTSSQITSVIRHVIIGDEHHITTQVTRYFNGNSIASWKDKFIVVEARTDEHYPESQYIHVFSH